MGLSRCGVPAPRATSHTTFLKDCGRGEGLRTTTCLRTVVVGRQGQAACKIILLHEASLSCQLNLMEIIRPLSKMRLNVATVSFQITLQDFCYVYIYIQGGPGVGLQLLHYLLHLNNYVLDVDFRK